MKIAFSLPELFGYSVFIETFNYAPSGKLLDWERNVSDTEIWIADKLHIVISNERHYRDKPFN